MSAKTTLIAVGFAALALGAAGTAYGVIAANTIDRQATLTKQGMQVRTSGPVACSQDEWISLRATVEQPATHARAKGRWDHRCTGEVQRWQVRARAKAGSFAAGRVRVCAVARTRLGRRVTDRRAWCARVRLAPRVDRIGDL
jgi:hypothetical protein